MERNGNQEQISPNGGVRAVHQGNNVYIHRRAMEISRDEMAKLLNITYDEYRALEKQPIIEEKFIIQIAERFNIGVEWLTKYSLNTDNIVYNQYGDGSNYQNIGDVHNEYHNSVDDVTKAYNISMEKTDSMYREMLNDLKGRNEKLELKLETEMIKREELLIKLSDKLLG